MSVVHVMAARTSPKKSTRASISSRRPGSDSASLSTTSTGLYSKSMAKKKKTMMVTFGRKRDQRSSQPRMGLLIVAGNLCLGNQILQSNNPQSIKRIFKIKQYVKKCYGWRYVGGGSWRRAAPSLNFSTTGFPHLVLQRVSAQLRRPRRAGPGPVSKSCVGQAMYPKKKKKKKKKKKNFK
jgi:hypothetical protein